MEDLNESNIEDACRRLRANDPSLTGVSVGYYDTGYGAVVGPALLGNTHVTELYMMVFSFYTGEEAAGSHRSLAEDFLLFLRSSRSLRTVVIDCALLTAVAFSELLIWFLEATAENPSVVKFELDHFFLDAHQLVSALNHLLRSTGSIQSLSLNCDCQDDIDDVALYSMGAAFATNRSLQRLTLQLTQWDGYYWYQKLAVIPIVSQLHNHPTLAELELKAETFEELEQVEALSSFVTVTTTLRRLTLDRFRFRADKMMALIQGLSNNRSIESLAFSKCTCNVEATQSFVDFMNRAPLVGPLTLRHLDISESRDEVMFSPNDLQSLSLPRTVISMCSPNSDGTGDGVGLQLKSLTLHTGYLGDDVDLLPRESHWTTLFRTTIPSMVHLQKLVVSGDQTVALHRHVALVRDAIRKSASLQELRISRRIRDLRDLEVLNPSDEDSSTDPFLSPEFQRRVQAYCERNMHLSAVMAAPKLDENVELEDDSRTDVSSYPQLYQVSQQAPHTAFTNTLIGLLAVGVSCQPDTTDSELIL